MPVRRYHIKVNGKWSAVSKEVFADSQSRQSATHFRFGLGDLVASIAQPIAKAIDAVAHTNIQNCGGCKKRREMLNRIHL
jgi:hypothetical protein